jgi:CRP/FNR family cyclic AMP-dependent transcriptional regulator
MIGGDGERSPAWGARMGGDSDGRVQGFVSLLGEAELADLHAIGRVQRFAKGARLLSERQVGDRVMALLAGRVKITGVNDAGRDAVFGFRSPGDLVGELSAIDGQPRSGSVEALEPAVALTVGTPDFLSDLQRHPPVALVVMRLLCERLRDADRKRIEFATADSVGRVAARLLELGERFGEPASDGTVTIDLPLTQEELASWTGSSREAVARALQTMRELGWVQTARRRITLRDLAALRARAG